MHRSLTVYIRRSIGRRLMPLLLLLILQPVFAQQNPGTSERKYLVSALQKIADPVLISLSKNELHKKMPVETSAKSGRAEFSHLEAIGRLLSGMAPWLELGADNTEEGKIRKKYIDLSRTAIDHATDPASPDFMNFNKNGGQPLVDAAFFAQAFLRAPNQLWKPLPEKVKNNVIAALKSSRVIKPSESNWLLFSAMVEVVILKFTGDCDMQRIDYALKKHGEWYVGDGTYGDGPHFHWDYYNSFVIQPMMTEILHTLDEAGKGNPELQKKELERAQRYATVQERLISPEGTYPPIGRSLAYRFGAFQLLAQTALKKQLPEELKPGQVRAALFTMIKKQMAAPGTFDKNGWLQVGMYGHQPGIGEGYISTGSLYLCSEAFLILGLPATDEFWTAPDEPWTQQKVWSGKDVPTDHAHD
ncbi:MAG: DUF2264 domain-containing protein [Mucilaginibacter polytrichastri]|nr:DUF2264 domain-containing protein [Mucilaginibacter polytrichastri]